jgi:hypothetical protein
MSEVIRSHGVVLKVIDALDHPHGGRILRVRLSGGEAPSLRSLNGATLRAVSPDGKERKVKVLGFPVSGGKASDRRLRETGRIDLLVEPEGEGPPVTIRWELHPFA